MASILATAASINSFYGNTNSELYKFNDTNDNLYVTKEEVESDLNKFKRYYLDNSDSYSNNQLVRLEDVKWESPIQTYHRYTMNIELSDYLYTKLPDLSSYRHKVVYNASETTVSLKKLDLRISTSLDSGNILSGEVNDKIGTDTLGSNAVIDIVTDLNNNVKRSGTGYLQYWLESMKITVKLDVIEKDTDTQEEKIKYSSTPITTTLSGSSIDIESVRDNFLEENSIGTEYQAGWRGNSNLVYAGLYDIDNIKESDDNIFTMYFGAGYTSSISSFEKLKLKLADFELRYPIYEKGIPGSKSMNIELNWMLQKIEDDEL